MALISVGRLMCKCTCTCSRLESIFWPPPFRIIFFGWSPDVSRMGRLNEFIRLSLSRLQHKYKQLKNSWKISLLKGRHKSRKNGSVSMHLRMRMWVRFNYDYIHTNSNPIHPIDTRWQRKIIKQRIFQKRVRTSRIWEGREARRMKKNYTAIVRVIENNRLL